MKFSFIIPTVRQTTLVRDCVASIRKFETQRDQYEVIVVDDGSDHNVQMWLKDYCDRDGVKCILKSENKGFAHTVNTGIAQSKGDYLILMNNDVVMIRSVLKHLEASFDRDPLVGVVGAKLLYPDMKVQHAGVVRMGKTATFIHVNKHAPRAAPVVCQSKYFVSVTGALFTIRRTVLNEIGGLNENYFLACEDTEYCLRVWQNGWRVYYCADVEALHQEGGTRGNTDQSKLKKGPQWFLKERETFAKFMVDLPKFNVDYFEERVRDLNAGRDVAPAIAVHEGHVVELTQVQTIGAPKLNYPNASVSQINATHCLEHVSWRKVMDVLQDWHRVLKPGGRLEIRTPDLEFIARGYLDGKTTKEWPADEEFIKANLHPEVIPGWWANMKLFAGQDNPANFHFNCFDFQMLKVCLERAGFGEVKRVRLDKEVSPGELQVEAVRPVPKVGNVITNKKKILVKRAGAVGDVMMTTPIVRRLKELGGEDVTIDFATNCGSVLLNNPSLNRVYPSNQPQAGYDRVVDLDLAYERSPNEHVIDAFSRVAFGEEGMDYDKSSVLVTSESDRVSVGRKLDEAGRGANGYVVVHMAVTWKNRTLSKEFWATTVARIAQTGLKVVQIGAGGDHVLKQPNVIDFTKQLTLHQIAALIDGAVCFVANDSGMMHIAGTTETPIVGIFTSAKGEFRVPYRKGSYGGGTAIVKPNIDCYGCLHREPAPVVFCDCRRGDFACLGLIAPEVVVAEVMRMTMAQAALKCFPEVSNRVVTP